jgi:Notch-like protein
MTKNNEDNIWDKDNDLDYEKGEGLTFSDIFGLIVVFILLWGAGMGVLFLRARHLKIEGRPNQLDAIVVASSAFMVVFILGFIYNGVKIMYGTQNSKMDKLAEFIDKWNEDEKNQGEWIWIENEDGTKSYYWKKANETDKKIIKEPINNNPCDPNPCLNDGECKIKNKTFECICNDETYGNTCENINNNCNINSEETSKCGIRGVCVNKPDNEFMCECKDTWDNTQFKWHSENNGYCNVLKKGNKIIENNKNCEDKLFTQKCTIIDTNNNTKEACIPDNIDCPDVNGLECDIIENFNDMANFKEWKENCPLYFKNKNYCKQIQAEDQSTYFDNYYNSNSCKLFREECKYATTEKQCNDIKTYNNNTNRCLWDNEKNICEFNNNIEN